MDLITLVGITVSYILIGSLASFVFMFFAHKEGGISCSDIGFFSILVWICWPIIVPVAGPAVLLVKLWKFLNAKAKSLANK
jgi:hypothetical protein